MSFFFQGNIYADTSFIINSSIGNSFITNSTLNSTSIDMLSTSGNYQNITSVKDPVNKQDASTKNYVDALGIIISNITLLQTNTTLISNYNIGSFMILVSNNILNGPSATFNITKNSLSLCGHIVRLTLSPGINSLTTLDITWPPNSGILLSKSDNTYDGSYKIKII